MNKQEALVKAYSRGVAIGNHTTLIAIRNQATGMADQLFSMGDAAGSNAVREFAGILAAAIQKNMDGDPELAKLEKHIENEKTKQNGGLTGIIRSQGRG